MIEDEEILAVFRATTDPVLFTSEVADQLPIKREGTLKRLHDLADSGRLQSKKNVNVIVWWLADADANS